MKKRAEKNSCPNGFPPWKRLIPVGLFALLASCTNYSASQIPANAVLLLGPSPSGTSSTTGISAVSRNAAGGVVFLVAAHNTEVTFKGYRIYQAATEAAVVDLPSASGTDCGAFVNYPVSSVKYAMEASTTDLGTSISTTTPLLCIFPIDLTTGNYVAIRARYFGGWGQPDLTSLSSNAVVVP